MNWTQLLDGRSPFQLSSGPADCDKNFAGDEAKNNDGKSDDNDNNIHGHAKANPRVQPPRCTHNRPIVEDSEDCDDPPPKKLRKTSPEPRAVAAAGPGRQTNNSASTGWEGLKSLDYHRAPKAKPRTTTKPTKAPAPPSSLPLSLSSSSDSLSSPPPPSPGAWPGLTPTVSDNRNKAPSKRVKKTGAGKKRRTIKSENTETKTEVRAKSSYPTKKRESWTKDEDDALIFLVKEYKEEYPRLFAENPIKAGKEKFDVSLFRQCSENLRRIYSINRTADACKMAWDRRLFLQTGIDTRKPANQNGVRSVCLQGRKKSL